MTDAVLWSGGRVFTGSRYAEGLLVEDRRVVGAGPLEALRRLAPTGTEHRSLGGRLLLPGLADAHLHLTEIARVRTGLDLSSTTSAVGLLARLREWGEGHPLGPVVGRGWDPERWTDRRWPDASELDRAFRDRAVVVYHSSGHAAVVNSAALEWAGLDRASAVPGETTVGRSADGRPNGRLFESALRRFGPLTEPAAPVGPDLLERTLAELAALGITSAGSMGVSREEVSALRELASAGRLPITVRGYLRLSDPASVGNPPSVRSHDRFGIVGVKAFLDGAFGPRTAWLDAPYDDRPDETGIAVGEESALAAELGQVAAAGQAIALHAIGDRAIARALRLLGPLRGTTDSPQRIEHAALTPPGLLPDLDRVGPTLVVQPGFVWSDHWLSERLGAERARWAYAFGTLRARGARLAGSSDAPFDPVDPWRGIRAAVRRRGPNGRSANPDPAEALSVEEAVRLYTVDAAGALGLASRGRLDAGAWADLVVLSVPTLEGALAAHEPPVAETWVEGRPVYRAPAPPGP